MSDRQPPPPRRRLHWIILWAVPLLFYSALTVVETWPLARHLRDSTVYTYGDGMLNAWILRWNLHQLPRHPLQLFQAPLLYPTPNALALSENMIGLSLLFWPLDLIFGETMLLHNAIVLFSFATLALTACGVFRRWTGSWWIGLLAGLMIGFAPVRTTQIAHIQLLSYQPTLLAVYYAARWLRGGGRRAAAGLFLAMAAQFLFSIYLFVFMAVFLSIFMMVYALTRLRRLPLRRLAAQGALGAAALGAVIYPVWRPYKFIRDDLGVHAQKEFMIESSVNLTDFVGFPRMNLLWGNWAVRYTNPYSRFPWEQWVALPFTFDFLILAGVCGGAWWAARRRGLRRRAPGLRLWLAGTAAGLGCVALMFGPRLHLDKNEIAWVPMPFTLFSRYFPGFDGIRGVSRFILPASLGLAMAALLPLGWACRHWGRRRPRRTAALLALLALGLVAETLNHPLVLQPVPTRRELPPVFQALAARPAAPLFVWPLDPAKDNEYFYMIYQSYFWYPMVNGRTGYIPKAQLDRLFQLAGDFPSHGGVELLRGIRVRYVVVCGEFEEQARLKADQAKLAQLERDGQVKMIFESENGVERLYQIL